MPSKSEAQHRLMEAAAHTPGGFGGVPQSVGEEFVRADAKDSAQAAGIMYNSGGKILLLKRNMDCDHGGTWCFPAGKIEEGEAPDQAALREFREEAGFIPAIINADGRQYGSFMLYRAEGEQHTPVLNDEHTEFMWADPANLPEPLHPGIAEQIGNYAMDYADTARVTSTNGFITIKSQPITRAGVFMYKGSSVPGGDPNKMYGVLRCMEELTKPETLESFKLLPFIDEHTMVGDGYPTAPEDKGVHGCTGEEISISGNDIMAPLRVFSRYARSIIEHKKGLSMGYKCRFEKSAGVFNGMPYDYIQRDIRGDHIALVNEGRCGTAVLDHHWVYDSFEVIPELEEKTMDKEVKDEAMEEKKEMSMADITEALGKLLPLLETVEQLKHAGAKADELAVALDEDTEKKDGDTALDEDEEESKKEKKEEAMDAADISSRINAAVKQNTKSVFAEVAARDRLVKEVSPLVGTFDAAEMTASEVAVYACEKLGIKVAKGAERAALDGYMAGRSAAGSVTFAMDSAITSKPKNGGLLAKTLAN